MSFLEKLGWDKLKEVGQLGITRLLRLQDETVDIFEEARNFDPESGYKTLEVDANGFGVLYKDSPERFLHSAEFHVCSGIALSCPSEGFYAMAHLYSNRDHYTYGEEKIELHGKNAWRIFEGYLPPHMKFNNAVAFGGKLGFDGIPPGLPDPELVKKYYPGDKPEDGSEGFHVWGQMAAASSTLLANAFFKAAFDSGRIEDLIDFRFQNCGHHVLIDKLTGEIYFGKIGEKLDRKIIEHTEKRFAGYLFPSKGLYGIKPAKSPEVEEYSSPLEPELPTLQPQPA